MADEGSAWMAQMRATGKQKEKPTSQSAQNPEIVRNAWIDGITHEIQRQRNVTPDVAKRMAEGVVRQYESHKTEGMGHEEALRTTQYEMAKAMENQYHARGGFRHVSTDIIPGAVIMAIASVVTAVGMIYGQVTTGMGPKSSKNDHPGDSYDRPYNTPHQPWTLPLKALSGKIRASIRTLRNHR